MAETTADTVIVQLEARLGQYNADVKSAETNFSGSMDRIGKSANDAGGKVDASAQAIRKSLQDAADGGDKAAKAFLDLETAMKRLAAAQAQAQGEIDAAKASYKAGTSDLATYNEALLQTKNALAVVENEHAAARTAFQKTMQASTGVVTSAGQQRLGFIVLGEQLRQVGTEFALGVPPMQIFAQQAGQVVQATQLMVGGTGKFAQFMLGPWGIAITTGIAVLLPLIASMLKFGDEAETAEKKLIDQAHANDVARAAQALYNQTLDGAIDREHKLTQAMEDRLKTQRQINQEQLAQAQQNAADLQGDVAQARQNRTAAQTNLLGLRQQLANPPAGATPEFMAGLVDAVKHAETTFDKADQALVTALNSATEAQRGVRAAQAVIFNQDLPGKADPQVALRERLQGKIDQATADFVAGKITAGVRDAIAITAQKQLDALGKTAKSGGGGTGSTPSLGDQVQTAQGEALFATANRFRGLSETANNGAIRDLLKQASINIDPKMVAWCAAFVNAVLATNGLAGTGSLSAKSFLNFGQATQTPQRGDIVVVGSGGQASHVGFFQGSNARGVQVLGGNTGNKVGTETVPLSQVLAFRRPPSAGETDKAQQRLADQAVHHAQEFAQQSDALDAQILAAKRAGATSLEETTKFQLDQIDAEKAKLEADIDAKQQLGTYTSMQATLLTLKAEELADARKAAVQRAEAEKATQLADDMLDRQKGALDAWAEIEPNTRKRADLEKRSLEIAQEIERRQLDLQIAAGQVSDATRARADLASKQLAEQQRLDLENQSPLQKYVTQIRDDASNVHDKVQGYVVDELQSVQDGIASALEKKLGTKDPLLAGLINLFIEQVIIRPIAVALAKSGGGAGGLFSGLASGVAGIFGFASGGSFEIGGRGGTDRNTLSLNGQDIANVSRGETLSISHGGLNGQSGGTTIVQQTFTLDARYGIVTPELIDYVNRTAASAGRAAYASASKDIPAAMRRQQRFG